MTNQDIDRSDYRVRQIVRRSGGAVALPIDPGQRSYGNSDGGDINLAAILRIIMEWRWLIVGAVAVGLVGAVLLTLFTTPLYRGTATIEINPPTVEILEDSKGQAQGMKSGDYLATQVGLLQSRSLAQRVAQDLNLASNAEFVPATGDREQRAKIAVNKLSDGFSVQPAPSGQLIKISYSATSPALAAKIANSFADSFIATNLERRYDASSYARNFLQQQIGKVKGELEKSERQLVEYAQAQGIINTVNQQKDQVSGDVNSLQGASLVALNQALAEAQTKRIAAEQAYRQTAAVGMTAEVNQSTQAIRQQRVALEAEYREKLTTMKPDYPDMISLRSRINELDRQIRSEAAQTASGRSNTLRAEYQAAAAAERTLQGRVAELKGSVINLRGRSIEYNILQREVDTNRSLYDALLQRYKEIGVAGGVGTNLVSIVDRAEIPASPFSPNLPFNLAIGLGLGLLVGIGGAFVIEFINDTITTPDDVRDKLKLASLGVIPKMTGQKSLAEELEDQTSHISEAYFSLRTSLQFTTDNGAPKSLLITSCRAAEGKSSTALAMAQNFARLGRRVLLIDADLRKPTFKVKAEDRGLSKLLTNHEPLNSQTFKTYFENLWLIPCGPLPPNPAELLATGRFTALLTEALGRFDMVIVDGPPVLGLADAPLLGAVCQGTLMVVESSRTRTKVAVDSINRLQSSGSQILGAVLTKFKRQSHGYGYGYGYSYEPYKYGGSIDKRELEIKLIEQQGDD
ncbi:GumC family protein [Sphingomonas colocasiae]|uniref:non-specific protein-tyrosine kinase n=1 Tax=Sphingomonas colocasiae TaxID=1848973 RepID=A0ABS7PQL5_9SPHN|nr:polysaccharide biosynthesis tyrosine autokinase [Sphingomonas colocasiae]MBY8823614.1 polysaccharide biosynthesis tyrosine autokinase [Sphingomonas colocasiae]